MLPLVAVFVAAAVAAPTPERLAEAIVDAIRAKNPQMRIAVLHEKSRACINGLTQPYFDWVFSRQFRYAIPGEHKVSMQALDKAPAAEGSADVYAVVPTHRMQIDAVTGANSSISIVVLVVNDGGGWQEVLPCPSNDTVARVRAVSMEADRQEKRAAMLAEQLGDALRSELLALLREGRKVEAVRRYAAVSGEDLVIARGVVERIGK